jgi:hypothetical protein
MAMKDSTGAATFTVTEALQPVRRRLGMARVRIWALRGLTVGAVVALIVLVLAHVVSLPWEPLPVGIGAMVLGTLAGAAFALRRWPDSHAAARAVDRHFALQDRLTTALEFDASTDSFPALQRDDARRRADGLKLEQSGRSPLDWREGSVTGVLIVAFVALLLVGGTSPGQARTVATAEQRQVRTVSATRVHQITSKVGQGLTPAARNNPALRKLQAALARLRRQLEHASTRVATLRAISATQAKLHRLSASLHPISKNAVAQLNHSLAHSMTAQQRAAATSSDRKALAAAAQTLRKLAAKLSHMNAAQRTQLARSLAKAANATGDSHLQAPLRQAASSLGYNDPQTAAQSLQQAASALAQTPAQRAAQSRVAAANSKLDALKNAVSGVSPGSGERIASGTPPNGSPGTGQGSGKGGGKNSGGGNGQAGSKGSGHGAGSTGANASGKGSGAGSGKGSGSGRSAGAGSGQGSPGGHGAGGGRGGAGHTGQGRYTTVYAPYKQGKGPSTTQTGPTGAPQRGPIVPYQQVVAAYGETAHQALDRANLPPSLRSYVRKYFSTVSH